MAVDYTTGMSWNAWNGPEVYHEFPEYTVNHRYDILHLCKQSLSLARQKNLIPPHASGYRDKFYKNYQNHYIVLSCEDGLRSKIYSYRALIGIHRFPDNLCIEIGQFDMLYFYDEDKDENNSPTNEELEKMLETLYNSLKEIYAELSNN